MADRTDKLLRVAGTLKAASARVQSLAGMGGDAFVVHKRAILGELLHIADEFRAAVGLDRDRDLEDGVAAPAPLPTDDEDWDDESDDK